LTKISTIYDALLTAIATALAGGGYRQLPNSYDITDNPEPYLRRGYGLAFGVSENTNREICERLWQRQSFTLPITNEVLTTSTNTTGWDDAMKGLMEDFIKVAKAIEAEPQIDESAQSVQVGVGGIAFLEGDRGKYVLIEISIDVEFYENLS